MMETRAAGARYAGPAAERERSLVPWFVLVLLVQGCFYLGLYAGPWLAERGLAPARPRGSAAERTVQWRQAMYRKEKDPPPGMALPQVALFTPEGRAVDVGPRRDGRTVLLFVGDADGCGVKGVIGAWAVAAKREKDLRVLVVARSVDPMVREACARDRGSVRMVLDPDRALAEAVNARWTPRAYLLDLSGRVEYVQPEGTMTADAPDEVRRLLRGPVSAEPASAGPRGSAPGP